MTNTKKEKISIRNFLYLDSLKLKSHSSQIFEGVTEYIIKGAKEGSEKAEEQKGPVGSGRIIGDILRKEGTSSEFKFLEDYAYSLFKEKLISESLLTSIDDDNQDIDEANIYVKITARVTFNDMKAAANLIEEFNTVGESMYRITNQEEISGSANGKPLSDNAVRAKAKAANLQTDKKFLDALSNMLKFGYQGLLEADMTVGPRTFSAPLKRENLREDESLIIHKYSRQTQMKLSMVGVIVRKGIGASNSQTLPTMEEKTNLKHALRTLVAHQEAVEKTFFGQSDTDIVIDPIALYVSM